MRTRLLGTNKTRRRAHIDGVLTAREPDKGAARQRVSVDGARDGEILDVGAGAAVGEDTIVEDIGAREVGAEIQHICPLPETGLETRVARDAACRGIHGYTGIILSRIRKIGQVLQNQRL